MTTLRALTVLLLIACLAMPALAVAQTLPPPPTAAGAKAAQLFVQLVINGKTIDDLVPIDADGTALLIAADDLRKAGLSIADQGTIDLAARHDIKAQYDALDQQLSLDVPLSMLPTARIAGPGRPRIVAQASTGATLTYDFYVQHGGGVSAASLLTEQRVFGRWGAFSNTDTLRITSGGFGRSGYLRYDTRYRYVDQNGAYAITAGDLITASLPWTTSVRMGGVQIGRSFAARPDLVTTPLPSFAGEAAVPSAVDLFIDGYRQDRTDVAPGRFVLDDMPVVNGAGQATIVTTDAVGRQVATTIPFYVSASLLRPGLTDFSVEAGALRRDYGLKSFDYGDAAVSAVVRRGITPHLTLEAHGEASRRVALAGAGADWAPGLWGTLHASAAASQTGGRSGTQLTVGYDYTGRSFGIAVEHRELSRDFRDLGDFDLATIGRASSDRVVANASLSRWGSVGIGYIAVRSRGGASTRLLSASWSLPIGRRASMFASADYDLRQHAASAQVRLVVPFGRSSASGGFDLDPSRGLRAEAAVDRAIASDGGWGYSAGAAVDQHGSAYGQATVSLRTRAAQFEAGASLAGRQAAGWAGVSGALVVMDGGVFAANDTQSSFAVVETGGVGNVPVSYENQPIGTTDAHGRLFVPGVTAYHPGRFAIDPLALDAGLSTTVVETNVAVAEGAGVIVRMPIRRSRSATAALIDDAGKPIAAGSIATLADGSAEPVGWGGIVFLADIGGGMTLDVQRRDGGTCRARIAAPATSEALAKIGPVPCR